MKISKSLLLQFTVLVFGVGMITGVLLHYADYGLPPAKHWAAWPIIFVVYGLLFLFAIAQFFAISTHGIANDRRSSNDHSNDLS